MSVLIIKDKWSKEVIRLIEKGLSDNEIAKRVPYRSDYVVNLRRKIKEYNEVKGV